MKINGYKVLLILTFICAFLLPTYFFQSWLGFDLVEYVFLILSVLTYACIVATEKNLSYFEIFTLAVIVLICFVQRSIVPLYLMELLVAYRFSKYFSKNKIKIGHTLLILCVMFVGVYSVIYFGYYGRYIYTGLREINQSGFAIFILFIIVRKYNKKIGNILLLVGLLTFSRNYLLCAILILIFERIRNSNFISKIYKYINFKNLTILSIVVLLLLSESFNIAYRNNHISEYKAGWDRYSNIYDYSNYFRFTVNTKLLDIYARHPSYLLTGITDEEFYDFSVEYSIKNGIPYKRIKPHNYFFSYLRIYGIFAILIFIICGKVIKNVLNKNNVLMLIVMFVYANFLGIGFSNYWLFLNIITLAVYRNDEVI